MYDNYCEILGVKPGASRDEIKHAFRKKAKQSHPDLNPSVADQEFIRVKKAFDYLIENVDRQDFGENGHYVYSFVRKKKYEKPETFDWESYRKWQNDTRKFYHPHQDIDFKKTVFGRLVFYSFHLVFLLVGIYILIAPTYSIIVDGIDPERNIPVTIFSVICASFFGLIMIVMMLLSGLSINIFKKL